jgi:hypothetical protein
MCTSWCGGGEQSSQAGVGAEKGGEGCHAPEYSICIHSFVWNWGSNLGLHACKVGALPLEPHLSPFCSGYLEMGSLKLFAWTGLKLQSS